MSTHSDQWTTVLDDLKLQMTKATFDTWLRNTRLISVEADTWTIGVQHAYALDWLANRLQETVERTASRIAGHRVTIRWIIAPPPQQPGNEPQPEQTEPTQILDAVGEDHVQVREDGSILCYNDFYIRIKLAFRERALAKLQGAPLSVFLCLALHVDRYSVSSPGIDTIMAETGYGSRHTVCSALTKLRELGLVEKLSPGSVGQDRYRVRGYAWFGRNAAPSLFELDDQKPDFAGPSAESAL